MSLKGPGKRRRAHTWPGDGCAPSPGMVTSLATSIHGPSSIVPSVRRSGSAPGRQRPARPGHFRRTRARPPSGGRRHVGQDLRRVGALDEHRARACRPGLRPRRTIRNGITAPAVDKDRPGASAGSSAPTIIASPSIDG